MKQPQLSNLQIAGVCRGLSMLLHAGIGLADSAFLLSQEQPEPMKTTLETMGKQLDQSRALWEAMEGTGTMPVYVTGMVRTGEETGHLEEALDSLANYYEENHRTGRMLTHAVAYPGMILLLMMCVIGVLLIYVMPVFDRVYASLGARLTGISGALLALGQLLAAAMPAILVLLAAAAVLVCGLTLSPPLREWVFRAGENRFGDRGIGRKFNNARFAQAIAMGLRSGLSPREALELAQGLLTAQARAGERLKRCAGQMEEGESLSDAMETCGLLSASGARMLAVGLRSGNGDRVMEELARTMMEEARQSVEDTLARVEPAMVLVSSALVGVILLSAMVPLMNIMTAIG